MSAHALNPLETDLEPLRSDLEWQGAIDIASGLFAALEVERSEFGWLSVRTAQAGWCAWIGTMDGQMAVVRRMACGRKEMMIL